MCIRDRRATNEVIDYLMSLAIANGAHQTRNPRAGVRLAKGDGALPEEIEHQLKMLEFLDGNGVEFIDPPKEVAIFFEGQRGGGGLAFQMRVVHQDRRQVAQHFGQPCLLYTSRCV